MKSIFHEMKSVISKTKKISVPLKIVVCLLVFSLRCFISDLQFFSFHFICKHVFFFFFLKAAVIPYAQFALSNN